MSPNTAMMLFHTLLVTSCTILLPVSAHFNLNYPPARGFNEDDLGTGPCGGLDSPSSNRTSVSITSLAIDLKMGHDQSAVQVLLGLGNNPGNNFNITLVPTFRQEGLGEFCLKEVRLPSSLGLTDGTNATLQVVTNGDPNGGLYNCADVTFKTGSVAPPPSCANGTGVSASPFPSDAAARNANESTTQGQPQKASSGQNGSATGSQTAATARPTGGAALATAGWGMLGAAFVGAVGLL